MTDRDVAVEDAFANAAGGVEFEHVAAEDLRRLLATRRCDRQRRTRVVASVVLVLAVTGSIAAVVGREDHGRTGSSDPVTSGPAALSLPTVLVPATAAGDSDPRADCRYTDPAAIALTVRQAQRCPEGTQVRVRGELRLIGESWWLCYPPDAAAGIDCTATGLRLIGDVDASGPPGGREFTGQVVAGELRLSTPSTPPTPAAPPSAPSSPLSGLTRPMIDLADCTPTAVEELPARELAGLYLWSSAADVWVQLIVPAGETFPGRFAVAVRSWSTPRFDPDAANASIHGVPARAGFASDRWGELTWRLPDGSEAYLRTSTMTEQQLIDLAGVLEIDPSAATRRGFDLAGPGYTIVDESEPPLPIGAIAESGCELAGGGWLRATVIDGPALGQALFLTDRIEEAVAARLQDDGRLVVVSARADVADRIPDALAALRQADDPGREATTTATS